MVYAPSNLWCTKGVKSTESGAPVFFIGPPIKICRSTAKIYWWTDNIIGPPIIILVHRQILAVDRHIFIGGPIKNTGAPESVLLTPLVHHSNFIAGRPKTALLFWFFGDFRCGALLFMVILVIYKYKNR